MKTRNYFIYLVLSVLVTFGLSAALQSILAAAWKTPDASAPANNRPAPIYSGDNNPQLISGGITVNDARTTNGFVVRGDVSANDISVSNGVLRTGQICDAGGGNCVTVANGILTAELDPKIGTIVNNKICHGVGSQIVCDQDSGVPNNSIGTNQIIASQVQRRTSGNYCSYGISRINEDGSIDCNTGPMSYFGTDNIVGLTNWGKYLVTVRGNYSITNFAPGVLTVVVSSFCGKKTYNITNDDYIDYLLISKGSNNYEVSGSLLVDVDCSDCANPAAQQMCSMSGHSIIGYSFFAPAGSGVFCTFGPCGTLSWPETGIGTQKISAILLR